MPNAPFPMTLDVLKESVANFSSLYVNSLGDLMISDAKDSDFRVYLIFLEYTQIMTPANNAKKNAPAVTTPATAAGDFLQSLLRQEDDRSSVFLRTVDTEGAIDDEGDGGGESDIGVGDSDESKEESKLHESML